MHMEIRLSSDIPQLGTFGDGMGDIASNEGSSIAKTMWKIVIIV